MRSWIRTAMLAALLLAGGSSIAGAQVSLGIRIGPPPPPRVIRVLPPRPSPEYAWVDGYWYPLERHYKWHPGYWTRPPYAGARWISPHHDGERFFAGYWDGDRGRFEHDHRWDHNRDRDFDRGRRHHDRDHDHDHDHDHDRR